MGPELRHGLVATGRFSSFGAIAGKLLDADALLAAAGFSGRPK